METTIWINFNQSEVLLLGISNTNNQNIINDFIEENGLTFPILYDSGSPGGVQGGDIYDLYYMPNDGSPYPRDFIIDQQGIIAYANNEIDTAWMMSIISELLIQPGDINNDTIINILDVIMLINFILSVDYPSGLEFEYSDLNSDGLLNVLDIILLVNIILS